MSPGSLNALIDAFVRLHAGMKQRGPDWYNAMGKTVGGSELAAIMGHNAYASMVDVIRSKVAALRGLPPKTFGGDACFLGTLFEDDIAAYVEIDFGSTVKGDDICVRQEAGHRNSPDGYIVLGLYRDDDGLDHLWTTDMAVPRSSSCIVLLEFKCPLTRKPSNSVPRQYKPQVWSGLAVSPIASFGLYVDAAFRKCALADLGDSPIYDTVYHDKDGSAEWSHPVAWGLTGVYAPLLSAPRGVRYGWRGDSWAPGDPSDSVDPDASLAAWEIHSSYFGLKLENQTRGDTDIVDFGDAPKKLFSRTLSLIDRRLFPVRRLPPCFADGRGLDLHEDRCIGDAIRGLRRNAPAHHWLLGVLPWKLLDVSYVPVQRRPGFLAEVMPLVRTVHAVAADAAAAPDPASFLSAWSASVAAQLPKGSGSTIDDHSRTKVNESDVQDLFDSLST